MNDKYPNLSKRITEQFPHGLVHFSFVQATNFDLSLISNVNIVPFVDEKVIIIKTAQGFYEIPGGTLEPGEHYVDTLKREILEEAGIRLVNNFTVFGYFDFHSEAPKPYRPHLPHPNFIRVFGYSEVEQVSAPTNPDDAEQVVAVECVPVNEAAKRFYEQNAGYIAELYLLAHDLRQT